MPTVALRTNLAPQTLLGAYRVVRLLGTGNMGAVYEGTHTLLNKRVAIKLMHGDLCARKDLLDRFLREGRAAVAIKHPHVVQVSDVGFHDGVPFLVMDFLEGSDLRVALTQRGRFPVAEACDLLLPIVAAVAAAHEAGVTHRDLKPENVFLVRPGRRDRPGIVPLVVDFGIAKLNDGAQMTATQTVIGSPAYMAPEQCNGKTGQQSDQWALAVMLYELCTGRPPFEADSQMALMYRICWAEPVPLQEHGVTPPEVLLAILQRALRKEPEQRFPSVRALGAALLPLCSPPVRDRHSHELTGEEHGTSRTEPGHPAPPQLQATTAPALPPSATSPQRIEVLPPPAAAPNQHNFSDTLAPSSQETTPLGPRSRRRLALLGASALALMVVPMAVLRPWAHRPPPAAPTLSAPNEATQESAEPTAPIETPLPAAAPTAPVQAAPPADAQKPAVPFEPALRTKVARTDPPAKTKLLKLKPKPTAPPARPPILLPD